MRGAGVLMLVLACLLGACVRSDGNADAEPPSPGSVVHAGPVELEARASAAEVRTVDRVTVTVRATADPGARLGAIALDPSPEGWTLVSRVDEPLRYTAEGRPERRATLTLEPFLEGSYRVPPATVAWTDTSGDAGTTSTDPIEITVTSVLAADDTDATLAAARPVLAPASPERSGVPAALVAAGVAVAFVGAGIGVWAALRARSVQTPDPFEDLRRAAAREGPDEPALAAVERAIHRAPDGPGVLGEIRAECERVRYGRAAVAPGRARELAALALRELEGACA